MRVEPLQRGQFAFNLGHIFRGCNANVNCGRCGCGDHIRPCSTTDLADIQSDATSFVRELRNFKDLMSEFDNRAVTFFEIQTGMRCNASDLNRIFADSLACCFHRAMQSVCRLEHQNGARISRNLFSERARRRAPHLFIGHQEQRHWAGNFSVAPRQQRFEHV